MWITLKHTYIGIDVEEKYNKKTELMDHQRKFLNILF